MLYTRMVKYALPMPCTGMKYDLAISNGDAPAM